MSKKRAFLTGKVPPESLIKTVFRYLGVPTDRLILGPSIGEDAAIVDMDDRVLVLSTDPITGAVENIGWLSVHINANDVATCGAKPLWYLGSVLLPEKTDEELLEDTMRQIDQAARELGISVIGGHAEVTPGLHRPIVIGVVAGEAEKGGYVTSRGARVGDKIVLTKEAGIEGTAILATDLAPVLAKRISNAILKRARSFIKKISVVDEAMIAINVGGVDAMHDPTEGGLINALWELSEASRKGVTAYEENIPIARETRTICDELQIDPLRLMSSGSLLIVIRPDKASELVRSLRERGIPASIIGSMNKIGDGRKLFKKDGSVSKIAPLRDDLYVALERFGSKTPNLIS